MNEFALRIVTKQCPDDIIPPHFVRETGPVSAIAASNMAYRDAEGLCLCGNWRLVNHLEIAHLLNLGQAATQAEVIIEGWKRWNSAIFERLRGSFAVCIYESRSGQTTLARDVFGMEPVYYVFERQSLAISNTPWAARLASGAQLSLDLVSIADYIRNEMVDCISTFHAGLNRLPPASILSWAPGLTPTITPYWSLGESRPKIGDGNAATQFRTLLDQSVSDAVVGEGHIGLMLSGGLDSSSLFAAVFKVKSAIAKVSSYTKSFEEAEWNDGPYLKLLRDQHPHDFHDMCYERHHPLMHMPRLVRELDGPSLAYSLSSSFDLNLLAASHGADVLLDGHGGDEVASYGLGRLNEFARAGQWLALWRATKPAAAFHECSRTQIFARYLAHIPSLRGLSRRYLVRQTAETHNDIQTAGVMADGIRQLVDEKRYSLQAAYHRLDHDEKMLMAEAMSQALQPNSLETLVLSSRAAGIRTAMPFYSRDLVEFSYALPSEEKFSDGMIRAVLRRSMEGRVPEELRLRTGKFDFYLAFRDSLLSDRELVRSWADSSNASLRNLVESDWLDKFWQRLDRDASAIDKPSVFAIWRIATLAMWLDDPFAAPRDLASLN